MRGTGSLSEEDLAGVVDREDRFTLGTAETARPGRLELFVADGTGEYLREHGGGGGLIALLEKAGGLFEIVLNIEELGEAEKLKDFVDLGLDLEEDDIAAAGLYRFEKRGEGAYARGGDVVEAAAIEDEPDISRIYRFADAFLEEIGIIGIDIAGEEEGQAIVHGIDFLEPDFQAVILLVVETGHDIIIVWHGAPLGLASN
jgi:hypothetical protein